MGTLLKEFRFNTLILLTLTHTVCVCQHIRTHLNVYFLVNLIFLVFCRKNFVCAINLSFLKKKKNLLPELSFFVSMIKQNASFQLVMKIIFKSYLRKLSKKIKIKKTFSRVIFFSFLFIGKFLNVEWFQVNRLRLYLAFSHLTVFPSSSSANPKFVFSSFSLAFYSLHYNSTFYTNI